MRIERGPILVDSVAFLCRCVRFCQNAPFEMSAVAAESGGQHPRAARRTPAARYKISICVKIKFVDSYSLPKWPHEPSFARKSGIIAPRQAPGGFFKLIDPRADLA
jgi:hypothetical protein